MHLSCSKSIDRVNRTYDTVLYDIRSEEQKFPWRQNINIITFTKRAVAESFIQLHRWL